jgi:hypothetical protein
MSKMYTTREKKPDNVIQVKVDISVVPSQTRKFARLKNKSQVFDDRRFRKPKYKSDYLDY